MENCSPHEPPVIDLYADRRSPYSWGESKIGDGGKPRCDYMRDGLVIGFLTIDEGGSVSYEKLESRVE